AGRLRRALRRPAARPGGRGLSAPRRAVRHGHPRDRAAPGCRRGMGVRRRHPPPRPAARRRAPGRSLCRHARQRGRRLILLCGIPSETSLAMAEHELERLGAEYVMFNQRKAASMELGFELAGGEISGELKIDGSTYPLREFSGVYTRLMDDRFLPELRDE